MKLPVAFLLASLALWAYVLRRAFRVTVVDPFAVPFGDL